MWGISLWPFAPSWRGRSKYAALSMQHWSLREADLQDNSTSCPDYCALRAATIWERSTLSLVHSTRCRPWLTLVSTHSLPAAAMDIWAGGRVASRLGLANLILLQVQVKSSQLYFWQKNLQLQNIQFSNTEINIEKKTATAVIKNELKYFPMSEGNSCIAEPNLEVLPLIWFSKGLV